MTSTCRSVPYECALEAARGATEGWIPFKDCLEKTILLGFGLGSAGLSRTVMFPDSC